MVTFTCNSCGDSVKKDKVLTHYKTKCSNCWVLSCIDCGKDFAGEDYQAHTSCISEAQKYQGALYKPKEKQNKGDAKQKSWLDSVANAEQSITDPRMKAAYAKLKDYSNIPRKEKKFLNFAKNSINIYDEHFLKQLFQIFVPPKAAVSPAATPTQASTNTEDNDDDDDDDTSKQKNHKPVAVAPATEKLPSIISEIGGTTAPEKKEKLKKEKSNKSEKKSKKDKKDKASEKEESIVDESAKLSKKRKKDPEETPSENKKANKSKKEKKEKKSKKK